MLEHMVAAPAIYRRTCMECNQGLYKHTGFKVLKVTMS